VARKSPDPKVVQFDFVDISSNTMPVYLHDFVFTIIDANHHTEDWTFKPPGDRLRARALDLKRGGESVPPPAGK
jgi:hypothetical protein